MYIVSYSKKLLQRVQKMSSRTFAGPFLRYDNCIPGSKVWKGSVLFLTKTEEGAQEVRGDANSAGAIPTIEIEDGGRASTRVSEAKWLDSCFGWRFWRFDIELELENEQRPVRYVVTPPSGSSGEQQSATFFVPGQNQSWHWGYTSCNGISHGTFRLTMLWIWEVDMIVIFRSNLE